MLAAGTKQSSQADRADRLTSQTCLQGWQAWLHCFVPACFVLCPLLALVLSSGFCTNKNTLRNLLFLRYLWIDCSLKKPACLVFCWVVMLPATTWLWHQNSVQRIGLMWCLLHNFQSKFWSSESFKKFEKVVEDMVRSWYYWMGNLSIKFYSSRRILCLKVC